MFEQSVLLFSAFGAVISVLLNFLMDTLSGKVLSCESCGLENGTLKKSKVDIAEKGQMADTAEGGKMTHVISRGEIF